MHVRQQIRNEIVNQLDGSTNALNNVYSMRVYPISKSKLPAIIVYTREESAENETIGDPTSVRDLSAVVEIYVKQQNDPDREIDLIAEQVESILGIDNDLNGVAKFIEYQGIEIEHSGEGDNAFFVASMSYSIIYSVKTGDAGTID